MDLRQGEGGASQLQFDYEAEQVHEHQNAAGTARIHRSLALDICTGCDAAFGESGLLASKKVSFAERDPVEVLVI